MSACQFQVLAQAFFWAGAVSGFFVGRWWWRR